MSKNKKQKPVMSDSIILTPKESKDCVIYVRMPQSDVDLIDEIKDKLNVKSRSEMIRTLATEAAKRTKVQA